MLTKASWDSDSWQPPGGLQPEISSPEETHVTPETALPLCTQETEQLGWGGDTLHCPTWGECSRQPPGHLSCSDLRRAQNAGPTESVPLWSTREPEWLRPGKGTQPRTHFREFPCRATWSLSSVDRESTHGEQGQTQCGWDYWVCKHSPHMPVIFACSVPPSLQHDWTNEPK